MMDSKGHIQERRRGIVEEMMAMESMKRGTLNEQMLKVHVKDAKEPVLRGPYYVLSRSERGKTVSVRVSADRVNGVREDVARHARFMELAREFVKLTEQLGELEREQDSAVETQKKTPKSPSRRTRR